MDLRELARRCLPSSAFLKRDRGDGLYVTDAPARGWSGSAPGFEVDVRGDIAVLTPECSVAAACDYPGDALSDRLAGFDGMDTENIALFCRCVKALETGEVSKLDACDRLVRQSAAEALRGGRRGEGLHACALVLAEARRMVRAGL